MRFFDSHAHYDDSRFVCEFEGGTEGAIRRAYEEGAVRLVNVGSSLASSRRSVTLAETHDFIYAAVGIHPCDAQNLSPAELDDTLSAVEELAAHEKVRAIGEIGYDYHYDGTDRERQTYFFDAQLEMGRRLDLPVIVHSRDASGDTFDRITAHPGSFGVLHSYSGSAEMARQLCDLGWYVSFSGPVTYKNAHKVKEAAAAVSEDRILIETDCPYLPPTPHRGEINYSGYLKYTCAAVAQVRGKSLEEMAEITWRNACRFFGIPE